MTSRLGGDRSTPPASRPGAFFVVEGAGFATGVHQKLRMEILDVPERWVSVDGKAPFELSRCEFASIGRCSRVGDVGPIEHLSAGMAIAGIRGWHLKAEHADLPLLDGSALPWFEEARKFSGGSCPTESVAELALPVEPFRSGRGGSIELRPSDRFLLDVSWSAGPWGLERWRGGLEDLSSIVPARTFIDLEVFVAFRAGGELAGAGIDSGRLLRGDGPLSAQADALAKEFGIDPTGKVWTGGEQRMPQECAAHKALDLVGDILLWLGYLPCVEVIAHDAGHALHHKVGATFRAGLVQVTSERPCP